MLLGECWTEGNRPSVFTSTSCAWLTNNGADISPPFAFLFVNVCELPVCDAEAVAVAVEADAPEIYNQQKPNAY